MHLSWRSVVRLLVCAAALALGAAPADAIIRVRVIGAAEAGCAVVSVGSIELMIVADIGVLAVPGILGAHWRVEGLPDGGKVRMYSNPAATASGDPESGVTMTFAECQQGPTILLAYVSYASYDGTPLTLSITGTPCPQLTLCNTQPPTICVGGEGTCTVGVEPASWSAIKTLYE